VVIIGWDVSTAAIGICVKRDDKDHLFDVIFPKGKTALEKWKYAKEEVADFVDRFLVNNNITEDVVHIVEQRLGGFTGGLTTKQTLMALAAINAVVSTTLAESGEVMHILPVSAKSIMKVGKLTLEGEDKKETVVRLARSSCPTFPYKEKKKGNAKGKVYPWVVGTDDMADAWLLAEAGAKVLKGEATVGQPKKASGNKGKARRAKGDSSP